MTDLMQIHPFIQSYVVAIASIMEVVVTIVDSDLVRVGGSGDYVEHIGERVLHGSFFEKILQSGKPGIIRDARKEFTCNTCRRKDTCNELGSLAYPIFLNKRVIGVISLIAFDESQREGLLEKSGKLEEFLKHMSALIESKMISEELNRSLERKMNEIISSDMQDTPASRFIGHSPQMMEVLALVRRIAKSDSAVLIQGESGTGKETIARLIHSQSGRNKNLLIYVNCAAIPPTEIEGDLFGQKKDPFLPADSETRIGKFELANQSTIVLDDVGALPLSVQTNILRMLQNKVLGVDGRQIPMDLRMICISSGNLKQLVSDGLFRQDLYYYLNVIPINLPPLREREGDIPVLTDYFINYFNGKLRRAVSNITADARTILNNYSWDGNVRELRNIMEYLVNITEGSVIRQQHLPEHLVLSVNTTKVDQPLRTMLEDYEKKILSGVITQMDRSADKTAIAKNLNISVATLYRRLEKYGLLSSDSQN